MIYEIKTYQNNRVLWKLNDVKDDIAYIENDIKKIQVQAKNFFEFCKPYKYQVGDIISIDGELVEIYDIDSRGNALFEQDRTPRHTSETHPIIQRQT